MLTRIKHFLAAPVFEDEEKTRAADLLNTILFILLANTLVIVPILAIPASIYAMFDLLIAVAMVAMVLGLQFLMRRGHVRTAGMLLSSALLVLITVTIYIFGGIRANAAAVYVLVVAVAALLLGERAAVIFGLLSTLATLGVFYAEISGAIVFPMPASVGLPDWIILSGVLSIGTFLLRFAVHSIAEGLKRTRRNAQALAESNRKLQASRTALEDHARRLKQRSIQLEASAEIGHAATSILETDQLTQQVVELIRERFGLYYVGLFLLDEADEWAVLQAATGEVGHQMRERGHRLKVGEGGIVGYVTGQGEPRIALDAGTDAVLLDNPDLPHTRSQMALPLRARGKIIGALDVQSTEPEAFSGEDRTMLQAMADQVAVALDNARLYEAAQRELTEREQAEKQLQHYAAELERANKEFKRLTYVASHNLRAPLVNLKGFSAELGAALAVVGSAAITALPYLDEARRSAVTTALQEDVPEALGFIDSSVTHIDRLTNALLELSRLGRRELRLEPVDVNGLVQATLQTLAHQIEERQVKVTVEHLPTVVADRISMEQIVGNILTNAVKYLDPNRPGEIEITAEHNPDVTTFHIRDNGRGIAEEDMDKVFTPFRRAGKQDVPGEGMGLAYVQPLLRRHGGRIWCESKTGVGTTFNFTISNHLTKGDSYV